MRNSQVTKKKENNAPLAYLQFDESGGQRGFKLAKEPPGDGWFVAPKDYIVGKICVLAEGKPKILSAKEVRAARLREARAALITQVKTQARQIIESFAPDWKQRNAMANALEAMASAQPVAPDFLSTWSYIKAIRARSDEIEAQILAADDPEAVEISFVGYEEGLKKEEADGS